MMLLIADTARIVGAILVVKSLPDYLRFFAVGIFTGESDFQAREERTRLRHGRRNAQGRVAGTLDRHAARLLEACSQLSAPAVVVELAATHHEGREPRATLRD